MKVVFVNPPLSGKERYGVFAKMKQEYEYPPLSLCYLAAVTRENGHKTKIFDFQVSDLDIGKSAELILKEKPDVIGFTSTTVSVTKAAKIADIIKKRDVDIPIILGGSHISAVPEETMQMFPQFDIGVLGEGEITLIELLEYLIDNRKLETINGLIFRDGNNLKITPKREFIKNLDTLPLPAWDLLPDIRTHYGGEFYVSFEDRHSFAIITSRGCIGHCTFCDNRIFGNICRVHSPKYILKMIKDLYYNYDKRHIFFSDDTFTLFKSNRIKLFNLLIQEKLDLTWSCNTRVDQVNPELLKLMRKAGCRYILFGIESGSQRMLDFIRKDTRLEQIEQAVNWTRAAGINVHAGFIIGLPTETKETLRETIDFSKKLNPTSAQFSIFTPLPGTELYKNINNYGGTYEGNWDKLNRWNIVFVPKGFTKEEIASAHKRAYFQFYFRLKMILTYLKMIKSVKHLKVAIRRFLILFDMLVRKSSLG